MGGEGLIKAVCRRTEDVLVPAQGAPVPEQLSLSPEELPPGQPEGPAVGQRLPVRLRDPHPRLPHVSSQPCADR